jgi:hypothetical protein
MSMNHDDRTPTGVSAEETDSPMFAPIPSWERGKKRRGLGASRSQSTTGATPPVATAPIAETRGFDSPLGDHMNHTVYSDTAPTGTGTLNAGSDGADTMIPRTRTSAPAKRRGGVAPLAVAAGVVMIGGLAAAGWYAGQPRDTGVAALTPGVTETSAAALETSSAQTSLAANTASAPPTPAAIPTARPEAPAAASRATTTRTAATVRTRPTPAASAADVGVNASATLPSAPMPYAATTGSAGDATTSAPTATSPTVSAPAPMMMTPAPETPPVTTPDVTAAPEPAASTPAPDLGPTP